MMRTIPGSDVRFVEHGAGAPVVVLHGAGVDHREAEACFEPGLARDGIRRIYPDLPGMAETPAPASLRSASDVVEAMLHLLDEVAGKERILLAGHSAGASFALAIVTRRPEAVGGLALVCPLLAEAGDVPAHRPVVADPSLGDDAFRAYFVVQTPEMLDRYERFVAPALPLVDAAAMERIGGEWEVDTSGAVDGPVLVVAGRQDSTVGSAAAVDLLERYPRATLAVLDGAGHALPHEQPAVLAALLADWLDRAVPGSGPIRDTPIEAQR